MRGDDAKFSPQNQNTCDFLFDSIAHIRTHTHTWLCEKLEHNAALRYLDVASRNLKGSAALSSAGLSSNKWADQALVVIRVSKMS